MLQVAIQDAHLYTGDSAPSISGAPLETLANEFLTVMATVKRLSKRYPPQFLEKLIYMLPLTIEQLRDAGQVQSWAAEMNSRLNDDTSGITRTSITVQQDTGNDSNSLKITSLTHGITTEKMMAQDFFESGEYKSIKGLGEKLIDLIAKGAYVQRGERKQEIRSFKQALNWLMDEAKRGQYIQRYKGLGEMNPEQLWDTTVNPETRRLLQVRIEDAVAADEVFTTLMGDQVEPRREFIETNALSVANLDV